MEIAAHEVTFMIAPGFNIEIGCDRSIEITRDNFQMSLLQCVRFMDKDLDDRRVKLALDLGEDWLRTNRVKVRFLQAI